MTRETRIIVGGTTLRLNAYRTTQLGELVGRTLECIGITAVPKHDGHSMTCFTLFMDNGTKHDLITPAATQ